MFHQRNPHTKKRRRAKLQTRMSLLVAAAAVGSGLVIVGTGAPAFAFNPCNEPNPLPRCFPPPHPPVHRPPTLPGSVDLSADTPPVGNQGGVNSCSAWATDYYLRGWYAERDGYYPGGGPDGNGGFAPMFTYAPYLLPDGSNFNHGETMAGNLQIQQSEGVDTRADYWQGDFDQTDQPTVQEKANAAQYKIASFNDISNPGGTGMQSDLERVLAGGNPAAVNLTVYQEFMNPTSANNYLVGPPTPTEPVLGSHDVFAYKYDQNGLWVENQWGGAWGDNGVAELSWAFVDQYVNEYVTIVPIKPT